MHFDATSLDLWFDDQVSLFSPWQSAPENPWQNMHFHKVQLANSYDIAASYRSPFEPGLLGSDQYLELLADEYIVLVPLYRHFVDEKTIS